MALDEVMACPFCGQRITATPDRDLAEQLVDEHWGRSERCRQAAAGLLMDVLRATPHATVERLLKRRRAATEPATSPNTK